MDLHRSTTRNTYNGAFVQLRACTWSQLDQEMPYVAMQGKRRHRVAKDLGNLVWNIHSH